MVAGFRSKPPHPKKFHVSELRRLMTLSCIDVKYLCMKDTNYLGVPVRVCTSSSFGGSDHDHAVVSTWIDKVIVPANVVCCVINAYSFYCKDFPIRQSYGVPVFIRVFFLITIKLLSQNASEKMVLEFGIEILAGSISIANWIQRKKTYPLCGILWRLLEKFSNRNWVVTIDRYLMVDLKNSLIQALTGRECNLMSMRIPCRFSVPCCSVFDTGKYSPSIQDSFPMVPLADLGSCLTFVGHGIELLDQSVCQLSLDMVSYEKKQPNK